MYYYYITREISNLLLMTVFYFLVLNFYIMMKTCSSLIGRVVYCLACLHATHRRIKYSQI